MAWAVSVGLGLLEHRHDGGEKGWGGTGQQGWGGGGGGGGCVVVSGDNTDMWPKEC